jgi:hypothetical protein
VFGIPIASGVGKSGNGGGESVGEIDLTLFKNSLFKFLIIKQGSLGTLNNSSPLSNVARSDKRDTDVIQIVADVIKAVRLPHLSTTIKHKRVLNT